MNLLLSLIICRFTNTFAPNVARSLNCSFVEKKKLSARIAKAQNLKSNSA